MSVFKESYRIYKSSQLKFKSAIRGAFFKVINIYVTAQAKFVIRFLSFEHTEM